MSDFYIPIEISDLQYILPPGEQIVYSTLCRCALVKTIGNKTQVLKWNTHVLFTNNYVAYNKPDSFKKNSSYQQKYSRWEDVQGMILIGGKGFVLNATMDFKLMRDINLETEEQFIKRTREFLLKYPPFIIEKKERWLEENRDNPEIKKRRKKWMTSSIIRLKGNYRRILAKEQKIKAKEEKKLAKKKK
ncbi:MAG: hypothetical protein ACTSQU_02230 [Promethearchaeota archaeon]